MLKKLFNFLGIIFVVSGINAQVIISDGFETYPNFNINPAGPWTFLDLDQDITYGIEGFTFPDNGSPMAFMVFNPNMTRPPLRTVTPHSGEKCLVSFGAVHTANNDWIISPLLQHPGGVTLKFRARSFTPQFTEKLKVGYTTTTTHPDDFIFVQQDEYMEISDTWTEFVFHFPAGTRHIALNYISSNGFALFIDDISISIVPPVPAININRPVIDFGYTVLGSKTITNTGISGHYLTSPAMASVSSPFSISRDGIHFSQSLTLGTGGERIYISYEPLTEGPDTGIVFLQSGANISDTIRLTGKAIGCFVQTDYPYIHNFDLDAVENYCWTMLDANQDANDQMGKFSLITDTADNGMAVYFHSIDPGSAYADDWLISPLMDINQPLYASFDYLTGYEVLMGLVAVPKPETFSVWALSDLRETTVVSTLLLPARTVSNYEEFEKQIIDLSGFAGEKIHIAIRVETARADGLYFVVDNFRIDSISPLLNLVSGDTIDFGTISTGRYGILTAELQALDIREPLTVTVDPPFDISPDGVDYFSSVQIPGDSVLHFNRSFFIRYNPVLTGPDTGTVRIHSPKIEDILTISLFGNAISCSPVAIYPYLNNFSRSMECWTSVNANQDICPLIIDTINQAVRYRYSPEHGANDWLISEPFLISDSTLVLSFDYRTLSIFFEEKFSVYILTEWDNFANAIQILPTQTVNNNVWYNTPLMPLHDFKNQVIQIGIKVESAPDQYELWITNFQIDTLPSAVILAPVNSVMDLGTTAAGKFSEIKKSKILGYNLTSLITISALPPFEISLDGSNFGDTLLVPANTMITEKSFYIRFHPVTPGSYQGNISFSSHGAADTLMALSGNSIDCSLPIRNFPWKEGFENKLGCWDIESTSSITWEITRKYLTHEGYHSISCLRDTLEEQNEVLGSPIFDFSGEAYPMKLSFWFCMSYYWSIYPHQHYYLVVLASTDGGNTYDETPLWDSRATRPFSNFHWTEAKINLQHLEGESQVKFAFVYKGLKGAQLLLDDITVEPLTSTKICNIQDPDISLYPNPASDYFYIKSAVPVERIEIYNTLSQCLYSIKGNDLEYKIHTGSFSPGVYMARIITQEGAITKKICIANKNYE